MSSMSLLFFAVVTVLCLMPAAVKADETSEYGSVIGIGESDLPYFSLAVINILR